MDADGHIIPIVEDDQGEGYKEVLQDEEVMDLMKKLIMDKEPSNEGSWDELLKHNPLK